MTIAVDLGRKATKQTNNVQQSNHGSDISIRPQGYKTFFMLNSTEHEISTAHIN